MKKKALIVGVLLVAAMALSANAYADNGTSAWHGFWNSVGGFFYNALPWNWGNWMGGQ